MTCILAVGSIDLEVLRSAELGTICMSYQRGQFEDSLSAHNEKSPILHDVQFSFSLEGKCPNIMRYVHVISYSYHKLENNHLDLILCQKQDLILQESYRCALEAIQDLIAQPFQCFRNGM